MFTVVMTPDETCCPVQQCGSRMYFQFQTRSFTPCIQTFPLNWVLLCQLFRSYKGYESKHMYMCMDEGLILHISVWFWSICSYPHSVLWCSGVAVLGQNVRAGSREVEVYSIKCFIVVLTPRPADPVSILALVRYWEENGQFTQTRFLKWWSGSAKWTFF